jgi:hypothetical protein
MLKVTYSVVMEQNDEEVNEICAERQDGEDNALYILPLQCRSQH